MNSQITISLNYEVIYSSVLSHTANDYSVYHVYRPTYSAYQPLMSIKYYHLMNNEI